MCRGRSARWHNIKNRGAVKLLMIFKVKYLMNVGWKSARFDHTGQKSIKGSSNIFKQYSFSILHSFTSIII